MHPVPASSVTGRSRPGLSMIRVSPSRAPIRSACTINIADNSASRITVRLQCRCRSPIITPASLSPIGSICRRRGPTTRRNKSSLSHALMQAAIRIRASRGGGMPDAARPAADLLCPGLAARRLAGGLRQFLSLDRPMPTCQLSPSSDMAVRPHGHVRGGIRFGVGPLAHLLRFMRQATMDSHETSKRVAARHQRLDAFPGEGTPPGDVACELLCEDHVGTYTLPYLCQWSNGTWRSVKTGEPVKAGVVAWRVVR